MKSQMDDCVKRRFALVDNDQSGSPGKRLPRLNWWSFQQLPAVIANAQWWREELTRRGLPTERQFAALNPRLPAAARQFGPALTRTDGPISGLALADDEQLCAPCHDDIVQQWRGSAHAAASLDNPIYRASLRAFRAAEPASLDELLRRLGDSEFDLVAVGRALIANPDWAQLVAGRKVDDLRAFDVAMLGSLL